MRGSSGISSRREFLKTSVAATCSVGLAGGALAQTLPAASPAVVSSARGASPRPDKLSLKKGVVFDMLPAKMSFADRCKLAKEVGLDVVQAPTTPDPRQAEELKKAADAAGIRIEVHLKDFKRREDGYEWVNLGDGDVDWAAVRQAFADVGYSGNVIAELKGGDETYLKDMVARIDRLLLSA